MITQTIQTPVDVYTQALSQITDVSPELSNEDLKELDEILSDKQQTMFLVNLINQPDQSKCSN